MKQKKITSDSSTLTTLDVLIDSNTTDNHLVSSIDSIDVNSQQCNYSEDEQERVLIEDAKCNDPTTCLNSLGINFQSSKIKLVPKGSTELEYFLNDLAKEFLRRAFSQKKGDKETHISKFISELIKELKDLECMMAPTDKTNGHMMMEKEEHVIKMKNTLAKVSNPISAGSVKKFKAEAAKMLETFQQEMS